MKGSVESHRQEFYGGIYDGRISGDDCFSEKALAKAAGKYSKKLSFENVVDAVCNYYKITINQLIEPGKTHPASEARGIAALLVQENSNLKLTALGNYLNRDVATLSQSANRLRKRAVRDKVFSEKIENIRKTLQ